MAQIITGLIWRKTPACPFDETCSAHCIFAGFYHAIQHRFGTADFHAYSFYCFCCRWFRVFFIIALKCFGNFIGAQRTVVNAEFIQKAAALFYFAQLGTDPEIPEWFFKRFIFRTFDEFSIHKRLMNPLSQLHTIKCHSPFFQFFRSRLQLTAF